MGTFEWVPMDPTGSATCLHQQIATMVLVGLVYQIFELYLDVFLAHASSRDDLILRLRQIFERFLKSKITLNPDKCELGHHLIKYAGHVIDETGFSIMDAKLSGVRATEEDNHYLS